MKKKVRVDAYTTKNGRHVASHMTTVHVKAKKAKKKAKKKASK